jgi:hypothetical protein
MKAIHLIKTFLLLALVASVSVRCSCDDTKQPAKTITQIIGSNNAWKIAKASVGAAVQTTGYSDFRITFTAAGSYTITRGGAPFSPSKTSGQTGVWKINSTGKVLTLDAGATERIINLTKVNENPATATIDWVDESDKLKPVITFDLVPAQ